MALTTVTMGALLLLQEQGLLSIDAACDFGSMEFDAREPANNPVFERLLRAEGRDVPAEFYDEESGRMYGVSGDLFRALGWEYASYDIDGRFGSTVVDLNVDDVPREHRGRYALTMNGGTSEHVFNQYNFFRQFHDVTRVGGLMLHVVPFHLAHNHGLFSYSPVFFHSLAHYNAYEMLGLWQCGKPNHAWYRPWYAKPDGRRVSLIAAMRRTRPDEFVFPLQVNEPMVLSRQAEERYGSFSPLHIDDFRLTDGLPDEFHLDVPSASTHPGPPAAIEASKSDAKRKVREQAAPERRRRFALLRR